jgi:hypothetical protein
MMRNRLIAKQASCHVILFPQQLSIVHLVVTSVRYTLLFLVVRAVGAVQSLRSVSYVLSAVVYSVCHIRMIEARRFVSNWSVMKISSQDAVVNSFRINFGNILRLMHCCEVNQTQRYQFAVEDERYIPPTDRGNYTHQSITLGTPTCCIPGRSTLLRH